MRMAKAPVRLRFHSVGSFWLKKLRLRRTVSHSVIKISGSSLKTGRARRSPLWAKTGLFPGGHLEFGESVAECATREVDEETGMQITNIRRGPYTEDFFLADNRHYITIIMIADWHAGEPELREPHKCEQWAWFEWDGLPGPLFPTFGNLTKAKINLKNYW